MVVEKNDNDEFNGKEKKWHRLTGNSKRKKHRYIDNEKESELIGHSLIHATNFVTDILEWKIVNDGNENPDNLILATFDISYRHLEKTKRGRDI